jgi:hypothetical protein
VIGFGGREFVWHPSFTGAEDEEYWPNVTIVVNDPNDYEEEIALTERFLSAVAYEYRDGIEVLNSGGAGVPSRLDPPVARALRRGLGNRLNDAPAELVVQDDDRLRLVLALHREGIGSESPFYRFMAFWNALDAAFDNNEPALDSFLDEEGLKWARDEEHRTEGWAQHLRDSNRNAIAHAVRSPGKPLRDPDDPSDRARLWRDGRLLLDLLRSRVEARWPRCIRPAKI